MDEFKKELFLEEHGYPVEVLDLSEFDRHAVSNYASKVISKNGNEGDFFKLLLHYLSNSISVGDLETSSKLKEALAKLGLSSQIDVLVVWYYPHLVSKFNLNYLIKYWANIWFSAADDGVCFYFPNIDKGILITHWGEVYH